MNIMCLIETDIKGQCCVSLVPFVDNSRPHFYCYHAVAFIVYNYGTVLHVAFMRSLIVPNIIFINVKGTPIVPS